jgi:predicted ArsR family transcriptional regulator
MSEHLTADAGATLLREVGMRVVSASGAAAQQGRLAGDRVRRAASVLGDLGGIVEIEDNGATSGTARISTLSCPLASAARGHQEVCQMIEAALADVARSPVTECCDRDGRPHCCFEMATGRGRAA